MNVALILNYKAATETISCAESLLAHCSTIDHIVIVDNDSQDGSALAFQQWLDEKAYPQVTLLCNPENNGYAGGNNYGLRWAMKNLQPTHFWVVNNDTYVESDAFSPLLEALQRNDRQFVGSLVLSADTGRLECYGGGKLYPILGKARLLGKNQSIETLQQQNLHHDPDYIMGCSLAFSAPLTEEIGLMDEDYFMYFEEVDWQYRARRFGVSIQVIPESRLFHYGSLSLGNRSAFYHYYRNRAATRFNKRFYGSMFAVVSAFLLSAVTTIKEYRNPTLAWSGIKGAFKGVAMSVK
ncbi:glycosyltransferase family 2 protein [Pseudomonas sp. MTM4]|uniref:glycosyltransferase family 2 protein n=1 Tax=unclassified Pseudomonas TaxID=196821 RepID=UPI0018D25BAE|nr:MULTISPECIES: glycosyltransferase family 2 protein [unclassified Pseudomonas]MBC8650987.1 glycosyltransferase family 2 protein [Pseudomonas sp. MT4]QXY91070.1 glycosyltransferase family 2 protein [Pseudomonas sp. MTM4]